MKNFNSDLKSSSFQIDFLKSCVYHATKLTTNHCLKLKQTKICKQIIDIYIDLNQADGFDMNHEKLLPIEFEWSKRA